MNESLKHTDTAGIIAFATSNFDAMRRFFHDLGMEIGESCGDPLMPLFTQGRGVYVRRGDIAFNLEESTNGAASARFNMLLFGYTADDAERLRSLGYELRTEESLHGTHYTLITPDGGTVTLSS